MDFGKALYLLMAGHKIQRQSWNGKGMWLVFVPASANVLPKEGSPYHKAGITDPVNIEAHIDMFTTAGTMQPGWLPSQADLFSTDWKVLLV